MLGLCVVALRLLLNGRLGVTGAYTDVIENVGRRRLPSTGAAGSSSAWSPGRRVRADRRRARLPRLRLADRHLPRQRPDRHRSVLLVAGVLIGYGSKTAGGCTSGNGLSGTSMLSPASIVATATFFATAIAVSFVIEALI